MADFGKEKRLTRGSTFLPMRGHIGMTKANDAFLQSLGYGFGAVANSQLLKNALDVSFHCAFTDAKTGRDFFVGGPFRH